MNTKPDEKTSLGSKWHIHRTAQEDITKPVTNPTHTADIMRKMDPIFTKRLSSWYVANGSVGWFLYEDGNEYEVLITPAKYGQHKDLREREHWWGQRDEIEKGLREQLEQGKITQEQFDSRMKEIA